jgi:hypothetical protein
MEAVMKRFLQHVGMVICALVVANSTTSAQDDLGKILEQMGRENIPKYLNPFLEGFAVGMNNAIYYSADLHDILGFDAGLRFGVVKVKEEQKTFDFIMPPSFTITRGTTSITFLKGRDYDDAPGASTVAGPNETKAVKIKNTSPITAFRDSTIFETPKGFNVGYLGSLAPQVNVGLPFGLEVMARYSPPIPTGDFGKVSFKGFGIRYDIDQWIPFFPIDIAAHFMTQSMTLKDKSDKEILTGSGTAYGLSVSKRLLFITVFGGYQLQSSKIKVNDITGTVGGNPFTLQGFEVAGPNKSQLTVGVRVLLLLVNVHAEMNLAGTPSYGAGVGISFR